MDIQPSIDLKKVNLQTAVGYLISLHENEYQWNLLGIKVIGAAETANDIPAGTYEYGDAYMIGTEPPYDMYIYTRPDGTVHTEGYWFNVGKFPLPGPQGPRGDGVETIRNISTYKPTYITYDQNKGISTNYDATIEYEDSETATSKSQTVSLNTKTPILPGKYVSINATMNNQGDQAVEIKVDKYALKEDFFEIDKRSSGNSYYIPAYKPTTNERAAIIMANAKMPNTICSRDSNGNCDFNKITLTEGITIGSYNYTDKVMTYGLKIDLTIADQNGGTLTASESSYIKNYAACRPVINGRTYNRISKIDPNITTTKFMSCDDNGTILILTCDTTNKTYTISTLASQAAGIYRHGIVMYGSPFNINIDIYDSNSATYTYSALTAKLATDPSFTAVAHISREDGTHISAALVHYNTSLNSYTIMYHNKQNETEQVNWTPTQVVDNGTPIYNS